jgi:regulator of replication initiation timing
MTAHESDCDCDRCRNIQNPAPSEQSLANDVIALTAERDTLKDRISDMIEFNSAMAAERDKALKKVKILQDVIGNYEIASKTAISTGNELLKERDALLYIHESDERALKAIAESADRYAVENERLREALNSVQKFYNAYMEQLAEPYMMDIPVLQEVEELRKLIEAEAAIIKKV